MASIEKKYTTSFVEIFTSSMNDFSLLAAIPANTNRVSEDRLDDRIVAVNASLRDADG